jgi:microcystin degradation protein MlrC
MNVSERLPVTYLFNHDCPSHQEGRALLQRAAEAAGVELEVTVVEVVDDAQAADLRFHGSPTYVLAGVDPFDPPQGVPIAAQACRAYARSDGRMAPLPSLDDLTDALVRATSTQGASR